jgi:hypothetical protein
MGPPRNKLTYLPILALHPLSKVEYHHASQEASKKEHPTQSMLCMPSGNVNPFSLPVERSQALAERFGVTPSSANSAEWHFAHWERSYIYDARGI